MRPICPPSAPRARSSAALSPATSRLLAAAALAALAAPATAQATAQLQFEELGKRYLPAHYQLTETVVWGDVDGDGDLDLVVGNYPKYTSGQNRLYLNNGSGGLRDVTATVLPADEDYTYALALGDIDGDGDVDLVVGNVWSQNRIYLNDGADGFIDATAGRLPDDWDVTYALALGDVDGDGDLDLMVGNGGWKYGQHNRLLLNDGTGVFADVTGAQLPDDVDGTLSLALEDVDGDGDRDLVTGNVGQNRFYRNDGSGTFTDVTATQMPVDTDATSSVVLGDVDGDGDRDLVSGNSGQQNRLYVNDGSGRFSDATATQMPVDTDITYSVVLGDIDGDGDSDLVVGNDDYSYGHNRVYRNDGSGSFTDVTAGHLPSAGDWTHALALGDIDSDGDRDLLVGNSGWKYGEANVLYLNDGSGVFADANATPLPADGDRSQAVVLGDVDGDGDRDLLIGNGGQSRLFYNDGRGGLIEVTATHLPGGYANTSSLALGDIDGDGDPDLVAGNYLQQNRLYRNDGNGAFTDITSTHLPVDSATTRAVVLGDVDGDGDLDLVIGNHLLMQNRLYRNDGSGSFSDVTATQLPIRTDDTWSLALEDVDGDTDLDLVVGNVGQNRLYCNDGGGTFTDVTAIQMPVDNEWTLALVLDDVDGDGDRDIVTGNAPAGWFSSAQNRLYLNDGGGTFGDVTGTHMTPVGEPTRALALADVDGDGDLDLVVGNFGQNRLDLNDGSGRFFDVTATWLPAASFDTGALALGNLDGDGDPDLVVGNLEQPNRLYSNLRHQLDAPQWLRLGLTYNLDVYARHGPSTTGDFALPYVSFVPAVPPIPLPPLGAIGLDPTFAIGLPLVVIPQPAGVAALTLAIPNLPALAGVPLYAQAVVVQNPVQIRLTNVTADLLQ